MFKEKSILYQWIISYFCILAVISIICAVTFVYIQKDLKEEIEYSNTMRLDIMDEKMKPVFNSQKLVCSQIMRNPDLDIVIKNNFHSKSDKAYSAKKVCDNIRSLVFGDSYVDEVYIYITNSEQAISSHGVSDAQTMYKAVFADGEYESFYSLMNSGDYGYYTVRNSLNDSEKKMSYITYVQSLPLISYGRHPEAVILVLVNTEKFSSLINYMGGEDVQIKLLDSDGNVLIKKGNDALSEKNAVISSANSYESGLHYIIETPKDTYWKRLNSVRVVMVNVFTVMLIIGIILSVIFALRNYIPIKRIVRKIDKNAGNEQQYGYGYLDDLIDSVLSEMEQSGKKIELQEKQIKEYYIEKIVKGESAFLPLGFLDDFKAYFSTDVFMICVSQISDVDNLFKNDNDFSRIKRYDLIKFIIKNVFGELIEREKGKVLFFTDKEHIVAVAGLPEADAEIKNRLGISFAEGADIIYEECDIVVKVAISDIHIGTDSLPQCLKESLSLLEYMDLIGKDGVEVYSSENLKATYNYTIEQENELVNSVKNGNFEKSSYIINDIYKKNADLNSPNLLRLLAADIAGTLIKIIAQEDKEGRLDISESVEHILDTGNTKGKKEAILNTIRIMCEYFAGNIPKEETSLVSKIKDYIIENYSDPDICIQKIAEPFYISPYYLSKIFRSETGEGILDFVNRCRINKAKELLVSSDMKIEDIAKKVGIVDARSFNRAFKRIEGMPPSKYREITK